VRETSKTIKSVSNNKANKAKTTVKTALFHKGSLNKKYKIVF